MTPIAIKPADVSGSRTSTKIPSRLYSQSEPPSLIDFRKLCTRSCSAQEYPLASNVTSKIPIYDLSSHSAEDAKHINQLQDEWYNVLLSGPGVLVLKNFITDHDLMNQVSTIFNDIIASEASTTKGDHFAPSGKNSRIWNSFEKHAMRDPASFLAYYSTPWFRHICTTWLGPSYQITAQVNLVRPGGQPQVPHRDYHLGFQTAESCARYPKAMHLASQFLTLQGGVAHSDVPLESGPTRFLPFSQMFEEGFMAYRLPQFQEYFDQHWVSLPLDMGDAVFFNPALFHAAGENRTSHIDRSVNLLQVSSAFGKTMEKINTSKIIEKCFDVLKDKYQREGLTPEVQAAVAAIADGYPFPTDLDKRPPAPGGMAPESEAEVLVRALESRWAKDEVMEHLKGVKFDSLLGS